MNTPLDRSSHVMKPRPRRLASSALALLLSLACNKTDGGDTVVPTPQPEPAPPPPTEPAPSEGRRWPEPPPAAAPKPVNFPDVASFQLPNRLSVYVIENHEVPIVTAQLVVRGGTMDDELLASFTASMLGEGTKSRTKAQLDEAIEFVGASLGACAGTHVSTVFSHSLASDLELALRLMADEVQDPAFSPEALDKIKQEAKIAQRNQLADPNALADQLFAQVVHPQGHPYGRPLPTEAEIDAIGVADLRRFHAGFYRANNAFLLLSGDITPDRAKPLVERILGGWAAAKPEQLPPNPLSRFKDYPLPSELVVHLVDRPDATQSTIRVGNLALARNHEDWAALQVTSQLLGGGPNARLFRDIREERSLTYGIYTKVRGGQAPGTFVIQTQTRTPTTGAMLAGIFEHINRIRDEEPQPPELEGTVRELVGSFPLQVETADQIVGKVREQIVYGLPKDYWRTYRDDLAQVGPSEVRATARSYIHALPVVVIVGNAAKVRPQVPKVLPTAKVVEYDGQLQRK